MTDLTTTATTITGNPFLHRSEVSFTGADGLKAGAAVVVTVREPSSWDDLLSKVATDMGAFMAVSRLADDGQDRAELLVAGVEGDVAVIDTLAVPEGPDAVTIDVVRELLALLTKTDVTLVVSMPRYWRAGSVEGRLDAAAEAGFQQWGDTDVWTFAPEN
jgi:hypothetical protein